MKVTIAIFAVAAILATTVVTTTATQQALADKVGPKPGENNVKQGALGEYQSQEGRDYYYEPDISGRDLGQQVQNYARPGDQPFGHESFGVRNLGDNFAFYASGECHDPTPDPVTPCE